MPLNVGSRLGHYDVTALIGEGGMGQVYQATDTKLKRQVALKILPDAFSADPERLARFQREAEVLASLNHPNIAAIHGLEEADGIRALVLELVEGPTLADRIKQGPIPLDEALPIAKQIAEALEAAHEQGVIHRDLKPANIKVRDDGTVKVLDFGLAKALAGDRPGADLSQSPTVTATVHGTQEGVILGTAAYMSPEQARGKLLDRRTDIWSFGCVLYEILTGGAAFIGETLSDTIAKVLDREPDWDPLPTDTPAPVRRLLRRCLDKDAKERLRDIGDARVEIREAISGPLLPSVVEVPSAAHAAGRRQALPLVVGISAVAVVIIGLAVWSLVRPPDTPADVARFTIAGPEIVRGVDLAISPDGTQIVYQGPKPDGDGTQLYIRRLDQFVAEPLPATTVVGDPFFSPDGEWVVFRSYVHTLERVSIFGGAPQTIAYQLSPIYGASWSADDQIIMGQQRGGLVRVPVRGGEPEPLTTLDVEQGDFTHRWPSIIPNHEAVLFVAATTVDARASGELAVVALDTGEVTRLGLAGTYPQYVATGHLVYASQDGSVRGVPFDADQLSVTGNPVTLIEGVVVANAGLGISHTGRLVYMTGGGGGGRQSLVWVDRNGKVTSPLLENEAGLGIAYPRLSPEGNRVALQRGSDIWVLDLERGSDTKLTDEGMNLQPTWTPDGSTVTFNSDRIVDTFLLYSRPVNLSGPIELLAEASDAQAGGSWSPDGQAFVHYEINPATGRDLWVLDRNGTRSPFLVTEFSEKGPSVSPDGQWVVYVSDQSGEDRVYAQPFPKGGAAISISTGAGTEPVWSRDGRELFYRTGNQMMVVPVDLGSDNVGRPNVLFEGTYQSDTLSTGRANYDVSLDGQQFLMVTAGTRATPLQINVVLNWHEELKRLVPVE